MDAFATMTAWKRRKPENDGSAFDQLKNSLAVVPRHVPGRISLPGWELHYVDSAALLSCFEVIVVKRWNDFYSTNQEPRILDCGSNIGVSIIHYKHLYPKARIIGFEPDRSIFKVLRENLSANHIEDVQVIEAAVWKNKGQHLFFSEGADSSKLVDTPQQDSAKSYLVETVRLADYLSQGVFDFLKLDIEGAEAEVIEDCGDLLRNVASMVVEFHYQTHNAQALGLTLDLLGRAGFRVAVNSYGAWLDMGYGKTPGQISENGIDQYFLICAWRS